MKKPDRLIAFVSAAFNAPVITGFKPSPIRWPWGSRATIDKHGIEALPDDHPVEYWVCCRVDEPWTWTLMTQQFRGVCCQCRGAIVFRVSEKSPTDPAVKKLCKRCAERLVASGDEGPLR